MKNRVSLLALIALFAIICVIRVITLTDNELSWDVFGYYLYLPATFIHFDPMLTDISWIHELMEQKYVTGTLYQLSTGPKGNIMFFFVMGFSILYLPFFLIGHVIALLSGFPADGFSLPYQYSISLGVLIYTFLGLYLTRKLLLSFFSDKITTLLLIIIVLGTNYFHFATIKNLESANLLFFLLAVNVWYTKQWHEKEKFRYLLLVGISIALSVLAKPSEFICVLIPALWGVYDKSSFREKINLIVRRKKQIILAMALSFLFFLPQMIYWQVNTGFFIYDSYKNPGIGLDFASPYILSALFSFRKGWLVYTPVMAFALIGFVYLYRNNRKLFPVVLIYFLATFYIISSWTEWWYGACFSNRPLITSYAILVIPFGYALERIARLNLFKRILIGLLILFFVILNLFQTWQLNNYILDPYYTTKAYYFAIFGKTKISPETKKLKLIEKSFTGDNVFHNEYDYTRRSIGYYDYSIKDTNYHTNYFYDTISQSTVFRLDGSRQFSPDVVTTYHGISRKDHAWIRASVDILIPEGYEGELPCLVMTMSRRKGLYGYKANCADPNQLKRNKWIHLSMDYLTPTIRNTSDLFQTYIWHRGTMPIYIDNFRVEGFEPK